jgi:hypothetical protein
MSDNGEYLKDLFLEGTAHLRETPPSDAPINATPSETTTPVEPPAPTETPATPEPTAPTITDAIRLQSINEMLGTNYASLEDAVDAKTRLSDYDQLKDYKSKYDEISQLPATKFHSKTIEELNAFASVTGIDDPTIIKAVKNFSSTTEKDPIEALVLAEILKDPGLVGRENLLRKQISRKYQTTVDEDLYGEELEKAQDEAELNKFQLERDASKSIKEIEGILEKVNTESNSDTISKVQEQRQQLKAQWEDVIGKNVDKIFSKIPITVPKGKDANGQETFETIDTLELPAAEAKQYANQAIQNLVNSGLELSDENLIKAVAEQHQIAIARNINKAIAKVQAKVEAEAKLSAAKEIHNPSGVGNNGTPPPQPTQKDISDIIFEKYMGR